ncbi:DUF3306 domain-containing protein [Zemynaea arenosa]|nr:DUF3306 domain-containing protein [Massilia arenosa]
MADGFLRRWSRLKTESQLAPTAPQPMPAAPPPASTALQLTPAAPQPKSAARPGLTQCAPAGRTSALESAPPSPGPTLEDVAALTADSDFAPFVTRAVDADVRRSALRKLFTDPHFNRMDGLDVYIGDYTQASPMPAAMLAALDHARNIFGPPAEDAEATATAAASDASHGATAAADLSPESPSLAPTAAPPAASDSPAASTAPTASAPDATAPSAPAASITTDPHAAALTAAAPETT